ncbi:MAG: D-aminoacyl-tRNA deacylase, partial [Halobaculum sp.]
MSRSRDADDPADSLVAVVVSRADEASEHIGERLRELGEWETLEDDERADGDGGGTYYRSLDTARTLELRSFDALHTQIDEPAEPFSAEPSFLLFASRHAGDTGPLLTCHFTGNFGPAEYGGEDRSFAPAAPGVQRALVAAFDEFAPERYEVGIECTHHGPTQVSVPSAFAELGSDESEWRDPAGATAVARAIRSLATESSAGFATESSVGSVVDDSAAAAVGPTVGDPAEPRHLFGVGGGHYAPRFERVIRETAWGVGHIAADWQLSELGDPETHADTLVAAAGASDATAVLLAGDESEAADVLADRGYRIVGERWVREVGERPLAVVDALESDLSSVEEGLRFGAVACESPDDYEIRDLPDDLLAAARRIDHDETRGTVFDRVIATETVENGNVVSGR